MHTINAILSGGVFDNFELGSVNLTPLSNLTINIAKKFGADVIISKLACHISRFLTVLQTKLAPTSNFVYK